MSGNMHSSRKLDIENLVNWDAGRNRGNVAAGDSAYGAGTVHAPKTGIAHRMKYMKRRREWRQKLGSPQPRFDSPHVAEAIMMYERGICQEAVDSCSRCKRGDGVSHECVSVPDIAWCCSNCLYDLSEEPCDATPLPLIKESSEEKGFWEDINERADRSFVLALVAQIQKRAGHGVDESPIERAEQIEQAAMVVSRLAGQWRRRHEAPRGSP